MLELPERRTVEVRVVRQTLVGGHRRCQIEWSECPGATHYQGRWASCGRRRRKSRPHGHRRAELDNGTYFPRRDRSPSEDNAAMRIEFTLDCSDLERTSKFWEEAAGLRVEGRIEDRYISLRGHGVALTLQRVTDLKTVKNRLHIDLLVEGLEQEVERLESLGASRLTPVARREFGQTWFVLADPEGNEFCVAADSSLTSE